MHVKHKHEICIFTCDFPKHMYHIIQETMKNIHLQFKEALMMFGKNIFKCMLNNEVMQNFPRRIQCPYSLQISQLLQKPLQFLLHPLTKYCYEIYNIHEKIHLHSVHCDYANCIFMFFYKTFPMLISNPIITFNCVLISSFACMFANIIFSLSLLEVLKHINFFY